MKSVATGDNLGEAPSKEIPVIYIDGVCLLCEYAVNFIYKRSKPGSFYFSLLQDHPYIAQTITLNKSQSKKEFRSVVVCLQNQTYISGEAMIFILKRMHFPYVLFGKILEILPTVLVNVIYNTVARNRFYFFKEKSVCSPPASEAKNYFIEK